MSHYEGNIDNNGNVHLYEQGDGPESGCIFIIVIIVLALLALPVVIMWWLLFRDFRKHINFIKICLNKFKRVVIFLWALGNYLLLVPTLWQSSDTSGSYNMIAARHDMAGLSLLALVLVGLNAFYLSRKGLNPWAGLPKVKYHSITRAIGLSEFILMGSFALLAFFIGPLVALFASAILTVVGYFVIENFL